MHCPSYHSYIQGIKVCNALTTQRKTAGNGSLGANAYPITPTFGFTENQYLAAIHLLLEQLCQPRVLFILLEEDELLCYPVVGFQLSGADDNSIGVFQEVCSN